ncbi:MAG: hypothetical protein JNK02_17170 [Planctomycetes bacterium]|nr:hypothetical protein [Planctomycetota bacterium]
MSLSRSVRLPVVLAVTPLAHATLGLAPATAAPISATSVVGTSALDTPSESVLAAESHPAWSFTVTPYFWLTRLSGSVDSGAETAVIDAPFSELFERLDGGGAIAFEGRRGPHGFLVDLNLVRLEQDLTGPANLEIDLEQTVAEAAYAWSPDSAETLQFLVGLRYLDVDTDFDLGGGGSASTNFEVLDPFVGAQGTWPIGDAFGFRLRGDVGGFGIDSELTLQGSATMSWRFNETISSSLGYRMMRWETEDGDESINLQLDGLVVAVGFSF